MVKTKDEIMKIVSDYIGKLRKYIKINRVILFGSYARDEALKSSDVDLAIVSEDFRRMNFFERLELLYKCWNYDIGADILGYTPEEFEELAKKISFVSEIVKRELIFKTYPAAKRSMRQDMFFGAAGCLLFPHPMRKIDKF
ncbi:nucleotidyltransferase domain-containing protein [Thermosediminibacter litoriperuensis]|uniref:Nucleotidyltransferase-like protein n=1 Tax=Thermosediminibacter litoriperuensis TaxID=291989 RepID=A0A5S5ASL9_9FIRM|nr:nucleotidyltransferase domain-containing protein [Thermosediminibacter litoriperuensis]TYP55444.1 nucleotidyltransferase-like protein [Thermosediminibacter litoriperuensis]